MARRRPRTALAEIDGVGLAQVVEMEHALLDLRAGYEQMAAVDAGEQAACRRAA